MKENLNNLKNRWQFGVARMQVSFLVAWIDALWTFSRKNLWHTLVGNIKIPRVVIYGDKNLYSSFFDKRDLTKIQKKTANLDFARKVIKNFNIAHVLFKENLIKIKNLITNKSFDLKHLIKLNNLYVESIQCLAPYVLVARWVDDYVTQKIIKMGFSKEKIPLAAAANIESDLGLYEKELLKLAKGLSSKPYRIDRNTKRILKQIRRNYIHITAYIDLQPALTDGKILEDFKNILSLGKHAIEQKLKKDEKTIKKISISQTSKPLLEIIKELNNIRVHLQNEFSRLGYLGVLFYKRIGKQLSINLDNIRYLSHREIDKCLKRGKTSVNIKRETSQRSKGYLILIGFHKKPCFFAGEREIDRAFKKYIGSDFKTIKKVFFEEEVEKKEEIKGEIAYPGKVAGVVKIVIKLNDIKKIQKGDILVANHTIPDFVPWMRKARAFITDEGGILSHAAIVAREMKTPCVIGTKLATKIFKDDDLIEVDANKGIVKIIKRAI